MARVPFLSRSGSHRRWWVLAAALVALVGPASARRAGPEPAPVVFDKQTLFILYSRVGSFPAQDRARTVAERLLDIANDRSIQPGDIAVKHGPVGSDIVVGDRPISHITDGDAAALGLPREALAERYADGIRRAITVYRAERSVPTIIRGALYALLATLTIVFVLWLFGLIFGRLAAGIEALKRTHIRPLRIQQSEVLTPDQVGAAFLWVLDAVRLVALAALVYAYLTIAFGFFPWTEGYAATLLGYVMGQVRTIGKAIVAEIPNVLFVVLIIVIARYVLKAIRFLFVEIERGAIGFAGFDREWAMPTFKLVRLLVVALAVIAAFPYVPGSKSPAFQGVSVLLGLIFSLGSSGAVANLVAGVVLTYMRPFRIGDRVQVADTVGDVVEKSMLVTRIRTIKNVEVTIPNSMVLSAHITNYSANARDDGLTLHTTVTIGYDAPWRRVHELLIEAARKTPNILARPSPYVLQTSLDDHYVSYELNAYTDQPNRMATTYSLPHQQIQDSFNQAGVEIMSPHYQALRDGNATTAPEADRPEDYRAPGFRVEGLGAREAGGVPKGPSGG